MNGVLLFALGVGLNAPIAEVGLVALAANAPIPASIVAGLLLMRMLLGYKSVGSDGQVLIELAGALRAGLSLRAAIAGAGAEQVGARAVRLALSGSPMDEVARAIEPASVELVAAVGLSGRAGGSIADALEALAAEDMAEAEARKEVRAAAAPMVMQALVVGGLPVIAVLIRLWSGSLVRELTGGDLRALIAAAGIAAVALGIAWIVALVRRALA